MAVAFNDRYLKMFDRQLSRMGVEAKLIGEVKNNQEPRIYIANGIPGRQIVSLNSEGISGIASTIKFNIDYLKTIYDIREEKLFPINSVKNSIAKITFQNQTYTVSEVEYNTFYNVIIFILDRKA